MIAVCVGSQQQSAEFVGVGLAGDGVESIAMIEAHAIHQRRPVFAIASQFIEDRAELVEGFEIALRGETACCDRGNRHGAALATRSSRARFLKNEMVARARITRMIALAVASRVRFRKLVRVLARLVSSAICRRAESSKQVRQKDPLRNFACAATPGWGAAGCWNCAASEKMRVAPASTGAAACCWAGPTSSSLQQCGRACRRRRSRAGMG